MALDSKRFDDVTNTRTGKKVPSFATDTQKMPMPKPNMAIEMVIRRKEPQLGRRPQPGNANLSKSPVPHTPPSGKRPMGTGKSKNVPAGIANAAKRRLSG